MKCSLNDQLSRIIGRRLFHNEHECRQEHLRIRLTLLNELPTVQALICLYFLIKRFNKGDTFDIERKHLYAFIIKFIDTIVMNRRKGCIVLAV